MLRPRLIRQRSLKGCIPLFLTVLVCAKVSAQDRFPAPGQPQAAMPANAAPVVPQQNRANADAGSGFRMPPASPTQTPGISPLAQQELQDFGIPPTAQLHAGAMHGHTPVKIPGGRVTTTDQLSAALRQGQQAVLLFHVLGGRETLPNAQFAAPASAPGTFNDETQQRFSQYLGQVTQGQKDKPLVFYCASLQCWMSYNAALRAINSGYSNVLWYRGGIEAWKAAGLPTSMQ